MPVDVLQLLRARENLGLHPLRAILEHLGPARLFTVLAFQPDELGYVFHAVDDVRELAVGIADRRIDRTPIAFLEGTALAVRTADVVLLDGHHIGGLRRADPLERRAKVPCPGRRRVAGVVGKDIEQVTSEDLGPGGHRRAEIGVAGGDDLEIGREDQVETRR